MGYFKKKSITEVSKADILQESDFSVIEDGKIYQWEYVPDERDGDTITGPGIFSMDSVDHEMVLKPTTFNINKNIMSEYVHTKDITNKIDNFFSKLKIYDKYGVFPKRGMLLHGPAGTGKSLVISKISEKYNEMGDTVVIYWPTDKFRASNVKDFLKSLKYSTKCKKMILIVEDIGGVSIDTGGQPLQVEPSLLSILDNVESIFKIPTMIMATTNFPENLLQNIANRPKRFDYLHEVKPPSSEYREKFLEFFSQDKATKEELAEIKLKKYSEFSVAHIEEIVIRHELDDITIHQSILEVHTQFKIAANHFKEERGPVGIS